ncbi:SsgA family sporulation/cell division regulator [Streptomyces sp. NPDC101234]|uniref:SsgA family sporulation/cell division regulator n=1 Tax=Streptomyces sp. NPDC101234 TaxID=3366138 RepID=UPI0037FCEC7C
MSGKVFGTDDELGCAHEDRGHRKDGHTGRDIRPGPLTCRTVVALLEEETPLPVMTDLRYDTAYPYSVFMIFDGGADSVIEWEFGRELLASGRRWLAGLGDVQIWPAEIRGHGLVYMSFRSGWEMFVVAASAAVVDEFLNSTFEVVPLGEEGSFLGMEGFVGRSPDET